MKASYNTLQSYFETKLPSAMEVADLLTMHSFEVESVEDVGGDQILDIKVLPNRAKDCSTELGIAREIATLIEKPLKADFEYKDAVFTETAVVVALSDPENILGFPIEKTRIISILKRVGCNVEEKENELHVYPPVTRPDLVLREDVVEEIGRIYGYKNVPPVEPAMTSAVSFDANTQYLDAIRVWLIEEGFSEVYTSSFRDHGKRELENPLASDKKFLRENLTDGLRDKLSLNLHNMPLLGLRDRVAMFEIGNVFGKDGEELHLAIVVASDESTKVGRKLKEGNTTLIAETASVLQDRFGLTLTDESDDVIKEFAVALPPTDFKADETRITFSEKKHQKYQKISPYPFVLRDVAVFVPEGIQAGDVEKSIRQHTADLLVHLSLFDTFTKKTDDGAQKTSYAFSLVFQSQEKTLSDDEINSIMEKITGALNSQKGWQVR